MAYPIKKVKRKSYKTGEIRRSVYGFLPKKLRRKSRFSHYDGEKKELVWKEN